MSHAHSAPWFHRQRRKPHVMVAAPTSKQARLWAEERGYEVTVIQPASKAGDMWAVFYTPGGKLQ